MKIVDVVKTITGDFQKKKDSFYYKVIGFIFMLAITVLSIVFSVNANVIKEYDDYNWYNPTNILAFVNKQIEISKQPEINELEALQSNDKPSGFTYLFIVDRTGSIKLGAHLDEPANEMKTKVIKSISARTAVDQNKLKSLSLQELLSLKMNISLVDEKWNNEGLSIEVGVAFYDGEQSIDRNIYKVFRPLTLYSKAEDYLQFIEKEGYNNKGELYKRLAEKFTDEKVKKQSRKVGGRTLDDRTNLKEIFTEIKNKYFGTNPTEHKVILSILSDFHHDVADEDGNLDYTSLSEVEEAIKLLATEDKDRIHQINLIGLPMANASSNTVGEVDRVLNKIKHEFTNTFYYHVDTPELIQEVDVNKRIKEIISPTIKHDTSRLVFYFPYINNKLGAVKETKTRFSLYCPPDSTNRSYFISLHSSEKINESANTNLVLGFKGLNDRRKKESRVLRIGEHLQVDYRANEIIEASFFNANNVQQYSDLSLNVFQPETNSKIRYPIIFRERLSSLNAELLGAACLSALYAMIIFILFVPFDSWLNRSATFRRKIGVSALHLGLITICVLGIWQLYVPLLNFAVLRIPMLFSILAIVIFYVQGFFNDAQSMNEVDMSGSPEIQRVVSQLDKLTNEVKNQRRVDSGAINEIHVTVGTILESIDQINKRLLDLQNQMNEYQDKHFMDAIVDDPTTKEE